MVNDLAQGHSGLLMPAFSSNVNFLRKTVSSIAGVFSASCNYLHGIIFFFLAVVLQAILAVWL